MAEMRNGRSSTSDREDTARADAYPPSDTIATDASELHVRIARKLLKEGSAGRAYGELVQATREGPMTPRVAAALVSMSVRAGTEAGAVALLKSGVEDNDGADRGRVRAQLVRLLRRVGEYEQAREQLTVLLAENPADRRARRVLNALLQRDERWEELDASLEREAREALKARQVSKAARATFWRGRISAEGLENPGRAALRFAQAAGFAEQAGEHTRAFDLRVLHLRALYRANAPERAITDAIEQLRATADRTGSQQRAEALIREIVSSDQDSQLIEAAEDAARRGQSAEAAAMLSAVVKEREDEDIARKLEALHIRRGAWRELAQFYRDRAKATDDKTRKLELLSQLAELLEDELNDLPAAATVYGEMVELGDGARALKEQVRVLGAKEDKSGVRRALDVAVEQAKDPQAVANALVARADAALASKKTDVARRDYGEALKHVPTQPFALAGLAELGAAQKDTGPAQHFLRALQALPRRASGRGELYRRLARLADGALSDAQLATRAWYEVLAETPEDEEAVGQLIQRLRGVKDMGRLEPLLKIQLQRQPRGDKPRAMWRELSLAQEAAGKRDEALETLRQAVRFEPGHQEAWLMLADRTEARGLPRETAWALEHAATATGDEDQRQYLWSRLATFQREVLKDERAAVATQDRADKLGAARHLGEPPTRGIDASGLRAQPLAPLPQLKGDSRAMAVADDRTPHPDRTPRAEVFFERSATDEVLEVTTGEFEIGDDDEYSSTMAERPKTHELELPESEAAPSPAERKQELFLAVQEEPLEPEGYRALADYFDALGDADRTALMSEIAAALEGDPNAAPRTPKLILNATDRAGLRHPVLRKEVGELLSLAGAALCRLHPDPTGPAGEFRMDSGKGAPLAAEALLSAVRILGLRAPDVFVAESNGPPFSLVFGPKGSWLSVGKLAVKKELPEAELRFFAGRALFTQNPDLLALRLLSRDQLHRGLQTLGAALKGGRSMSEAAQKVREALSAKAMDRLSLLFDRHARTLNLNQLLDGARHSANRAGLVVCGGVAPALSALKAKKALRSEVEELIRFSASERYLKLRARRV